MQWANECLQEFAQSALRGENPREMNLSRCCGPTAARVPEQDRPGRRRDGDERSPSRSSTARPIGSRAGLARAGRQPGDRVAIGMHNVPHFPFAYFGILRAGAVVVPLNVMLTEHEIARVLADSGAKVALAADPFASVVDGGGCRRSRRRCSRPRLGRARDARRPGARPRCHRGRSRRARVHVGHDRRAQGSDADPRQPAGEPRPADVDPRSARDRGRRAVPCASAVPHLRTERDARASS